MYSNLLASRLDENKFVYLGKTHITGTENFFFPHFIFRQMFCNDMKEQCISECTSSDLERVWKLVKSLSFYTMEINIVYNYFNCAFYKDKREIYLINNNKHGWMIRANLKMVYFVLEQQNGFIKYPCFFVCVGQWSKSSTFEKKKK